MYIKFQCNNPKTKEPKLEAAMRIVPEWKDYDNEIKSLWDRIYNTKSSESISGETGKSILSKSVLRSMQIHKDITRFLLYQM